MGTVADKLTYLNETKDKIKYSINLTGAGITNEDTFRSYAVKLRDGLVDIISNGTDNLYNDFPKVSGSGSEITLENTLEAPMYINKLNGDTFQEGTPTPSSPQEIKCVKGGQSITIEGNANNTPISDSIQLVYETDYSVVVGNKNTLSATGNMQKFIDNGANDNQWYFWRDVTNDRIYYSNRLVSGSMNDYYAVVLSGKYSKFEYNSIGVTYNKESNSTQRKAFIFLSEGELPYLPNSSSSGTSTFNKWTMRSNTIIIDTQFLFSSQTNKPIPNVYYYKTNETWSYSGDMYYSTDIVEGANEVYFRSSRIWNLNSSGTKYCSKKFTLRIYSVGLSNNDRLYDGDYITGTPDNWSFVRNMQEVVFDGSENWIKSTSFDNTYYISNSYGITSGEINLKSNYISNFIPNGSTSTDYQSAMWVGNYLNIKDMSSTTLQLWKDKLSTNNMKLLYPLSTPTTTPITGTTLIGQLNALYNAKSRQGITYIKVNANVGNLPVILDVNILKDEL